ncbi:MAG: hypothetical protein O9262_10515 [Cyclobacteriaceae bacterium]|nr:hypothetical protein [Cyclobacteriaceae bacterium]
MKKLIGILLFASICVNLFGQLGAKVQQVGIYGTWLSNLDDYQMRLVLNKNGEGELDDEAIRFTVSGNKLIVDVSGETISYNYVQQGNTLTVSGGDLEQAILFTRATASGGTVNQEVSTPSNNTNLVGIWSAPGERLEFKSDGKCIYLGNTFSYTQSGTMLTIITTQGNAQFSYRLTGNQLHLMANGQEVVYTRGDTNNNTASSFSDAKNVDQSLVGKWCWTNTTTTNTGGSSNSECIVLQANGTYQYAAERAMDTNTNAFYGGTSSQSSDQGRWWVQGDRIYYDSQTRGQGSYRLERRNHPKTNDPMIVLDGDAYVTFYQKAPWR